MDEFLSRHRRLDQPFRHEPTVRPESVRERIEVLGVALDGEEIDAYYTPFWDAAGPSQRHKLVMKG